MKKLIISYIFCLFFIHSINPIINDGKQIEDIAEIVLNNDLKIDEWEVTIKEKMDQDQAKNIINKLKKNFSLTEKENQNSIIYSFTNAQITSEIVERYNVIIPKKHNNKIEVLAVLTGDTWNNDVKTNYNQRYNWMTTELFTNLSRSYTCLTTEFNGIIDNDYFSSYIREILNVQNFKTQIDKNENSMLDTVVYGYTPLWSQKVTVKDIPMNLQMATIKDEIGAVKFILGTPILINEY